MTQTTAPSLPTRRVPGLRTVVPLAAVAAAGFAAGPWLVGFAIRAWDSFFFPALVEMSLSGLRWCL